jgi:AbrB family looped-hinge helix DNA binding protein
MNPIVAERGQVTIPKALRDKLGIVPGTELAFTAENGRLIATKVVGEHPALKLMGRNCKGRRTADIMTQLRGPAK